MIVDQIIIVMLRQPDMKDKCETRADPFYHEGSFGTSGCHRRNLMNRKRIHELEGARLAFAQGGPLGFRLINLTPPTSRAVKYYKYCELVWEPTDLPFRYETAPCLINSAGESDFPLLRSMIANAVPEHWLLKFSSGFRSRRRALNEPVAKELIEVYTDTLSGASPSMLAQCYIQTLPREPNVPLRGAARSSYLEMLRAKANERIDRGSAYNGGCGTLSAPPIPESTGACG